jgi:hypothetical protein
MVEVDTAALAYEAAQPLMHFLIQSFACESGSLSRIIQIMYLILSLSLMVIAQGECVGVKVLRCTLSQTRPLTCVDSCDPSRQPVDQLIDVLLESDCTLQCPKNPLQHVPACPSLLAPRCQVEEHQKGADRGIGMPRANKLQHAHISGAPRVSRLSAEHIGSASQLERVDVWRS